MTREWWYLKLRHNPEVEHILSQSPKVSLYWWHCGNTFECALQLLGLRVTSGSRPWLFCDSENHRWQGTKLSPSAKVGGKAHSNTPSTCHCEWLPVPTECLCRGHRMFLLRRWVRKPWEAGKCCWCWDCWMQQPVQHRLAEDSDSLTEKSGWMLNFRSDLTEISICRERRYSTNYNRCVFLLQQPHYNAFIPSKLL